MALDQLLDKLLDPSKTNAVILPKFITKAEEPSVTQRSLEMGTADRECAFINRREKPKVTHRGRLARQSTPTRFLRYFEHGITWLCGLWAFGIGLRFTIELLASDGWIHMPKHPLNIWFDFFPLCIFGLLVVLFEVRNLISIAYTGKPSLEDSVHE